MTSEARRSVAAFAADVFDHADVSGDSVVYVYRGGEWVEVGTVDEVGAGIGDYFLGAPPGRPRSSDRAKLAERAEEAYREACELVPESSASWWGGVETARVAHVAEVLGVEWSTAYDYVKRPNRR